MFGIALGDLAVLVVALAAAGVLTGIFAGLFGVGGGAVLVTVLYELFRVLEVPTDVRMHLSIGTALAIILPTSISSWRAHKAKGGIDEDVLRLWTIPIVAGVLAGAVVAAVAPGTLLKVVFISFATFNATKLIVGGSNWRLGPELPGKAGMRAYGFGIGAVSTLVGIGGGGLGVMVMTFYGRPILQAIATSSFIGILVAVPATLGYMIAGWPHLAVMPPLSIGYVSIIGTLLIAPLAVLTAPLGVRLAHRFTRRQLEVGFGLFMVMIALRFAVSLVWG